MSKIDIKVHLEHDSPPNNPTRKKLSLLEIIIKMNLQRQPAVKDRRVNFIERCRNLKSQVEAMSAEKFTYLLTIMNEY